MADFVSLGFAPNDFWTLTFSELRVVFDGALRQARRDHDARAWLAWHMAALSRTNRMPRLSELTTQKERPAQDWQANLAAWESYIASREAKA